ncbi:uncharacterized protein LOC107153402 [Marmota marmota marmota]|uniref:uncharacterized protein LOC107153402 n=1 Tax=Marmota marmota marmota TaxID=9994 RepID=UPI00209255A2|nr:uncharacterized protein LOC107153402 [Marmota marmota marmota]
MHSAIIYRYKKCATIFIHLSEITGVRAVALGHIGILDSWTQRGAPSLSSCGISALQLSGSTAVTDSSLPMEEDMKLHVFEGNHSPKEIELLNCWKQKYLDVWTEQGHPGLAQHHPPVVVKTFIFGTKGLKQAAQDITVQCTACQQENVKQERWTRPGAKNRVTDLETIGKLTSLRFNLKLINSFKRTSPERPLISNIYSSQETISVSNGSRKKDKSQDGGDFTQSS